VSSAIETSVRDGIGRLVLNDPPLNILTRDLLGRIRLGLEELRTDDSLSVLVLSAMGKHFSAGADVKEHLPPEHTEMIPEFLETIGTLDAFPIPVIAAVQGRCLGGGFELAQAADLIIAAESAVFGQPEILLGVIAPAACALLPRLQLGSAADEMLFTGDPLPALDALQSGLVRRVVPDTELEEATMALAGRIARNSPAALRLVKRALRGGEGRTRAEAMELAGHLYLDEVMATRDALEGLEAFMEKRVPEWAGR
jgi:cyclohexa-1,5-dienecarbonyl-CoA hydratase